MHFSEWMNVSTLIRQWVIKKRPPSCLIWHHAYFYVNEDYERGYAKEQCQGLKWCWPVGDITIIKTALKLSMEKGTSGEETQTHALYIGE